MSKLKNNITKSDEKRKEEITSKFLGSAGKASKELIAEKEKSIEKIKDNLDKLINFSTNEKDVIERINEIDPKNFLEEVANLKIQIEVAERELKIMKEAFAELLDD